MYVSPFQTPIKNIILTDFTHVVGISAIPKSQAALLPNRTVPFPRQEENYIITLDVFHQLHCLVRPFLKPLELVFRLNMACWIT